MWNILKQQLEWLGGSTLNRFYLIEMIKSCERKWVLLWINILNTWCQHWRMPHFNLILLIIIFFFGCSERSEEAEMVVVLMVSLLQPVHYIHNFCNIRTKDWLICYSTPISFVLKFICYWVYISAFSGY